jgi:hypothetical protein
MRTTVLKPAYLIADLLLFLIVLVVISVSPTHLVSAQAALPTRTDLPPFLDDIKSWSCTASDDHQSIKFGLGENAETRDIVSYLVKVTVTYKDETEHPAWIETLDAKKTLKAASAVCVDWSTELKRQLTQRLKGNGKGKS